MSTAPLPRSRGATAVRAHVESCDGPAAGWYAPRPPRSGRGPGPLQAVGVHRVADGGHWHLVTYGLSEPGPRRSGEGNVPGWGFELTLRVSSEPGDEPPLWAVDFLASLASYVGSRGHPLAEGHLLDLRGPIRIGSSTAITAGVVVADPVLASLDGPHGRLQFLQVVGLTADELELCRAWNVEGVVDVVSRSEGDLLVTRLDRPPVTADPTIAAEISRRVAAEGSDLHELRIATLRVRARRRGRVDVKMGAGAAAALGPALRRELVGEGASFTVVGDDSEIRFTVGAEPTWSLDGASVEATVPLDGVDYVAALFDGRTGWGRASDWPGLRFGIVR